MFKIELYFAQFMMIKMHNQIIVFIKEQNNINV